MHPATAAAIGQALGHPLADLRPAGTGFSENWHARAGGQAVFIKLCPDGDRLQAEADGLTALAACRDWVVPAALAQGDAGGNAYLVLEWLALAADGDPVALAAALAALHGHTGSAYGWHRANYLGATPQDNGWDADWASFFASRRLAPQLQRAGAAGFATIERPGARLLTALPDLFAGHRPSPTLLHGDFWRGNVGFAGGRPCCFDPAVHYGDGECDLAMAALFGGFSPAFFAAYDAHRPPLPGWDRRRRLYQLYHLLNHLNLFGAGYLGQVLAVLDELASP